jgi:hypothetical protein
MEVLHTLFLTLLASPSVSGHFDGWQTDCRATGNVYAIGDNQKLTSVALQRRACQTLTNAVVQISFSGFDERTGTMPGHNTGVLE